MECEGIESPFTLGYRRIDGCGAPSRVLAAGDLVSGEVSGAHEVIIIALDAVGGGWGWWRILKVV
jgi:hypothetical protein